ncbi:MAG: transcriptional regulator NanR [Rhizobiales bacterium]|nr:transcriptional regulator NanR [Hyphomicrobiales bacterium]MBI3671892.1 transcriptional regulator NanR [Hyphomicrobiales bacterium]
MSVALKRSRLFEQVAEILEQRIRDRLMPAGAELPSERQLMKEFGVGRTAVREALFHLQRMGLVELRTGARARVAIPSAEAVMTSLAGSARYVLSDADGMRHFQEARVLFETGLVRDAARHATAADIARLGDALTANREAIGDLRRFEETDVGFHYAIAATPNNPIYAVLHTALIEWLVDQRRVTLSYPGQNRVAYDAHAAIFEAIAARDPDQADARMRSHLAQVSDLYWKVRGAPQ